MIVDTDIGSDIDDALCLAYLFGQSDCEILGITTCSSEPEKRAEIADSMCQYIGTELPIYPGRDMPVLGKQLQVAVYHYDVVKKLPHKSDFPKNKAIDFMREMIEKYPHQITLLPIGPFTNIGALIAAYPHLVPLIKEISVMGGSFFDEAISFIPAEWNIRNDPVAAKIVFDSGIPIRAFGLDVTLKLKIKCTDFLKESHPTLLKPVALYAEKFLERTNDMYFHDALPAVCLFDNSICTFKRGMVEVDITEQGSGRTYFKEDPSGSVLVADYVDTQKFYDHYYNIIERYSL